MELEMWRAHVQKGHAKAQSISRFQAEKEAWKSSNANTLPSRPIILGCDMPTGNIAYDKRYVIPKLPRRKALEDVYAGDVHVLMEQVRVLNESQDVKINVRPQDSLETVVMALVESDIIARPLTNPQLEKETSLAVLEREARIRGIRLYAVFNDVDEMRRQISEVSVITGEQIEEVVYEPHVDEDRDKMKIRGPQHAQGGCDCGGMVRGCEKCGKYIGWKYRDVLCPEAEVKNHEVPSPTCAVDVVGQF